MRLNTKILVGFGIALVVLVLSSSASLLSIYGLRDQTDQVQHTYQVMQRADSLNALLRDAHSGVRGYRLTYDTAFLRTYQHADNCLGQLQKNLRRTTADNPSQQLRLDSLLLMTNREMAILRPLAEAQRGYSPADLLTTLSTDRLTMKSARQLFARVKNEELRLLAARTERQNGLERLTPVFIIASGIFAILTVLWFFSRIMRELNGNERLQNELQTVNADVARRIGLIRELAQKVVGGDYSVKVPVTETDGLGDLAVQLNRMTQSLDQSFSALRQRNQELDQFAYVASHDLKAPLRGVMTIVKWIEQEHPDEMSPQLRLYLEQMRGRLARLEELINGLLAYARVGRTANARTETDVAALLGEVAELVVPPDFTLEIGPGMPTFVTDRLSLQQVFTNLLSNAVKYHHRAPGRLAITVQDVGTRYEFRVQDDGPGIAPEYHTKIFQLFQTLRDRHTAESTGIGLSIVKKIIDEQMGSIRVDSAAGQGAGFIFTWPK